MAQTVITQDSLQYQLSWPGNLAFGSFEWNGSGRQLQMLKGACFAENLTSEVGETTSCCIRHRRTDSMVTFDRNFIRFIYKGLVQKKQDSALGGSAPWRTRRLSIDVRIDWRFLKHRSARLGAGTTSGNPCWVLKLSFQTGTMAFVHASNPFLAACFSTRNWNVFAFLHRFS